jgi:two-component system, chemotaxis family, protein-glutamate methylesterase/glutaminase
VTATAPERRDKVVVVEDSPTVRAYLSALVEEAGFDVCGQAEDVAEAEALVRREEPDLILSDIHLPDGDGIELTRRVLAERGVPIVLITAHDPKHPALVFRAMAAGALEVLPKPPARHDPEFAGYLRDFQMTLRTLAGVPVVRRRRVTAKPAAEAAPEIVPEILPVSPHPPAPQFGSPPIIAIGASTGGPVVIGDLLIALRQRSFAFAVVVQHIVPDFAESFRSWLEAHARLRVLAARDRATPEPNTVYTVPAGSHLRLRSNGTFEVLPKKVLPTSQLPSIDALFESLASLSPKETIAILLTGMWSDGAAGLLRLRRAGALTVAQSPATAAVDSMPRTAIERGAASLVLSPRQIAEFLEGLPPA